MTDRRTVVEVIATAALEVDVPIDDAENLPEGVEAVLSDVDNVRHVGIEELGDVTSGNGQLRVDAYARVTLHFDPGAVDEDRQAWQNRLVDADGIATVTAFEVESGPYRIEAW